MLKNFELSLQNKKMWRNNSTLVRQNSILTLQLKRMTPIRKLKTRINIVTKLLYSRREGVFETMFGRSIITGSCNLFAMKVLFTHRKAGEWCIQWYVLPAPVSWRGTRIGCKKHCRGPCKKKIFYYLDNDYSFIQILQRIHNINIKIRLRN